MLLQNCLEVTAFHRHIIHLVPLPIAGLEGKDPSLEGKGSVPAQKTAKPRALQNEPNPAPKQELPQSNTARMV